MGRKLKFTIIVLIFLILYFIIPIFADTINWIDYTKAKKLALENNKHMILYFYTDWCTYCKKMSDTTFKDQKVIETMNKYFYNVKINAESDKVINPKGDVKTMAEFAYYYNVRGTPTLWFLEPDGTPITNLPGYAPADVFYIILKYIHTNAYKTEKWEDFYKKNKK